MSYSLSTSNSSSHPLPPHSYFPYRTERARTAKLVGASQECQVVAYAGSVFQKSDKSPKVGDVIYTDSDNKIFADSIQNMKGDDSWLARAVSTNGIDDLRSIFITSQITFVESEGDVTESCPEFNLLGMYVHCTMYRHAYVCHYIYSSFYLYCLICID